MRKTYTFKISPTRRAQIIAHRQEIMRLKDKKPSIYCTIGLRRNVYAYIRSLQLPTETNSDTVERLLGLTSKEQLSEKETTN